MPLNFIQALGSMFLAGNVRKSKHIKDAKRLVGLAAASLSTDEVLERIQQQMAEVMASAQEAANNAVTNENEARAIVSKDGKGERWNNLLYLSGQLFEYYRCVKIWCTGS